MFTFNYAAGATLGSALLVWLGVFAALFLFNEVARRSKVMGFVCFIVLPTVLSVLWFTVLNKSTYTDWFHLAKVYSSTAGCIGFWCIRHEAKPGSFADARATFTEEQLKKETERCLGCGAAVVDEFLCVGCGQCTTKCKFDAISLVRRYDGEGVSLLDMPCSTGQEGCRVAVLAVFIPKTGK